jgi:peroxiredoxin
VLGRTLPDVALPATDGTLINPRRVTGLCVYFCYPYTGKPGVPNPEGWDHIPGAHGSTPQALAYSGFIDRFSNAKAKVFGISLQDGQWQKEFVERNKLRVPLLSDHKQRFASTLKLETFAAGAQQFLKRITLIARGANIIAVRDDIVDPKQDATEALALVESLA